MQNLIDTPLEIKDPNPAGMCWCSCGGRTKVVGFNDASHNLKIGFHRLYIHGHHSRGKLPQRRPKFRAYPGTFQRASFFQPFTSLVDLDLQYGLSPVARICQMGEGRLLVALLDNAYQTADYLAKQSKKAPVAKLRMREEMEEWLGNEDIQYGSLNFVCLLLGLNVKRVREVLTMRMRGEVA